MDPGSPSLDAIVVLGCRPGASDRSEAALARRAERAARAFREHGARAVIASGGRRWRGISEAELLALRLTALGVPPDAVVRELCSLSTLENAWYSAELLRTGGFSRAAVVTCDWHMPRALACFAAAKVDAVGLPARSPHRTFARRAADFAAESVKRFLDQRTAARWKTA